MSTYNPNIPPQDGSQLLTWLDNEHTKIAASINDVDSGLRKIWYKPPDRVLPGLVLYADGTDWNPGSGEGLYRYSLSGVWVFIG